MGNASTSPALEAFSQHAPVFDAIDRENALIGRMRAIVRNAARRHMQPGERLLELNAGTGIDSLFFAQQGLDLLATDAAPGMLAQLEARRNAHPELRLAVQERSFLDLDTLPAEGFDHVFSNFGGINCTPDLERVLAGVDHVLRPGGTCALVIMPRLSPWELLAALKGHFRLAFRRWRRGGAPAQVEGVSFPCHYHEASEVRRLLGERYAVLEQRALSLLVPPPHVEQFDRKHPRLYRTLDRMEEALAHRWPFRAWGDHYLIILRKRA